VRRAVVVAAACAAVLVAGAGRAAAQARWSDPSVIDVGREPPHASFVPYPDRDAALQGGTPSPWVLSLDGPWRFSWVPRAGDAPAGFEDPGYDDDGWGDIPVPSNQEIQGYGVPLYLDAGLPPGPPGFVDPETNAVGSYRRWVDLPAEWEGLRVVLHFASVGAAVAVWVNGHEVGYAQGSKVPTEFDVSSALHAGRNLVAARVWRWSDGSYLEDVDFWRLSGMDRDVWLQATPTAFVRDVVVRAGLDEAYVDGRLTVDVALANTGSSPAAVEVGVELLDPRGRTVLERRASASLGAGSADTVSFRGDLPAVARWTAETPELYTLLVTSRPTGGPPQVLRQRVGFRTVEVSGGLLKVNGVAVTLRGVNRHEHDPATGRYVSEELMLKDVRLMKELNINAVRTSHYPDDPRWYDLADEHGLYLVDEAFVESNGTSFAPDSTLAGKPEWREAHLDRLRRMVVRDRNHPSVILWSLGNEAGDGANFEAMYALAKRIDPSRPAVYEMADLRAHTDVFFPMYARIHTLEIYAAERRDRPLILSEYAHAMGNSVGNLGDYWDVIRAHEQLQGGFLWDWVDQAFPVVRDGHRYWGYGDDFGGHTGGGNFSVNGLVAPDRSLHPHAWEVRKVYQPVAFRAVDLDRGRIEVENLHDFLDLGGFSLRWRVTTAAGTVGEGTVADVAVDPLRSAVFDLPLPRAEPDEGYERFLEVELVARRPLDLLPEGHVLAWEQFPLDAPGPRRGADLRKVAKIRVTKGDGRLVLRGEATDFRLDLDLVRGEIASFTYLGRELVSAGPRPNFWRPPTDNDYGNGMPERQGAWREASREQPVARVEHWQNSDRDVEIVVARDLPSVGSLHVTRLHVFGNGEILVSSSLETGRIGLPDLPKVGLTMVLADSLRRVEWFGRGPHESYADRKRGAKVGRWSAEVDDLAHVYIRPQETGNLTDVRWIALSRADGVGILAVADSVMSVSALPNPDADYDGGPDEELRHAWDVRPRGPVYLDLDHAQMGVGGDTSWGARVHPEYTLPPGPYAYRVRLVPFGPGGRPLEVLARERW